MKKFPSRIRTGLLLSCMLAVAIAGFAPWSGAQNLEEPEEPEHPAIETAEDARLHGLESLMVAIQNDGGVPLPSNLSTYVQDKEAAIQLGKALFWDMQVGSDAVQACASCHFHAGADSRAKNQLNPGILRVLNRRDGDVIGFSRAANTPDETFEVGGPNYTLSGDDFPFVKVPNKWLTEPDGTLRPWPGNSHDIASDAGVFLTWFEGITAGQKQDQGEALYDPVWNVNNVVTRRAEPRHAPSVINAVLNFTNFWDGRAAHHFNGVTPFGDQDLEARIFTSVGSTKRLTPLKLRMRNASLASQAVGPPLSFFEMSFGNGAENFRIFPELGRKLMSLTPLGKQWVSPQDSVLGALANPSAPGLDPSKFHDIATGQLINGYRALIQKAFRPIFWNSPQLVVFPAPSQTEAPGNQSIVQDGPVIITGPAPTGANAFTQMEANMAFFFGVSVMLYESTLVSDRTPFDRWIESGGKFIEGFGEAERRGLNVFANQGKCINCHGGPEFTNASVRNAQSGRNVIEPMLMAQGQALYDNGFYNISVTLTPDDLGRGGNDPFGRPLAFSRQSLFKRLGIQEIPFPIIGDPFPARDELGRVIAGIDSNENGLIDAGEELLIKRVAVDGAFKTPGLRNVELTGPYFHNGGTATLRQVVQFYNRGGNFRHFNIDDLDPDIQELGLSAEEQSDLVKFMIALTDPRVKYRAAPFDHPELFLPNGHPGNHLTITAYTSVDGIEQASDTFLHLPAVGRHGSPIPLQTFLGLDPQAGGPEGMDESTSMPEDTSPPSQENPRPLATAE